MIKNGFFAVFLTFGLLGSAVPGRAADVRLLKAMEEEIASLMEENRSCVVSIHAITRRVSNGDQDEASALTNVRHTVGTGVLFDAQGRVLTTSEVVGDADYIQVSLASGQLVVADLMAVDEDSKVAVIQLQEKVSRCPRFGDSDRVRMGHYAFVIGNAYGTMAPSVGTVVDLHDEDDLIHISGAAWPGNSGAAVFNSDGQVVGIVRGVLTPSVQEILSDGERADGPEWNAPATLLAIPINQARQIAQRLISGGFLGVEVNRHGMATISRVEEGGPASEAGLRVEDVIVSFNSEKIVDGEHLGKLVAVTSPGKMARVGVQRDGRSVTVQVRVGQRGARVIRKTPPPAVAYGPIRRPAETPEMLIQRLREQMQMLLQDREGKKEK